MTEKEFMKQVWRPYDTVLLENGMKGSVTNVCFSTRSVRIGLQGGGAEWFRCELISEHRSSIGGTEDALIIEQLHNNLLAANEQIGRLKEEKTRWQEERTKLQDERKELQERLSANHMGDILKNVNIINANLAEKKKRIERIEACMAGIAQALQQIDL